MRSTDFSSPTIIIISDRTDLDDQLSKDFTNAKKFIGDEKWIINCITTNWSKEQEIEQQQNPNILNHII